MLSRLNHAIHGTKYMENAWGAGTLVNQYGDRSDSGDPVPQIKDYKPFMSPVIDQPDGTAVLTYGQGEYAGLGYADNVDYHNFNTLMVKAGIATGAVTGLILVAASVI